MEVLRKGLESAVVSCTMVPSLGMERKLSAISMGMKLEAKQPLRLKEWMCWPSEAAVLPLNVNRFGF